MEWLDGFLLYDIKNWEGLYSITKCGKVYAHAKKTGCNQKGRWLKIYKRAGYLRTCLSHKGKDYHLMVHRLLAIIFLENPNEFPIVNHLDGNTLNNSLENLEWCTQSENVSHSFKNGMSKPLYGEKNPASKLKLYQVKEIKNKYIPKKHSSRKLANEYNVAKSTILRIVNGKNWNGGEMAQ